MSVHFFKSQLKLIQGLTEEEPIALERREQELVGTLLQWGNNKRVQFEDVAFENFCAALAEPVKPCCTGAVLYLHGGGYVCGDLSYAKGFGSVLCREAGVRVLCPAYRLAPEFPYPAALEDALASYLWLLERVPAEKIVFVGESAGGGLLLSLCLAAREQGLPLPGGLVCISPWTDLSLSGESYEDNADIDFSMTKKRLQRYAACYGGDPCHPLVSPLFGDLHGLPESLLFVGGLEVMLDDTRMLHRRLLAAGCRSTLTIAPNMWHGYVLYGFKGRQEDLDAIRKFLREKVR